MTEQEALDVVFKSVDKVVRTELVLTADQQRSVERIALRKVEQRHNLFVGVKGDKAVGYAVITNEIGKYKPITFIVGVDADGKVTDVSIMVYREPIGSDVRKKWWTEQLKKKTVKDPLRVKEDVNKIPGSTLSCEGVAAGVKKVLAVVSECCIKNPDFVRKLIKDSSGGPKEIVLTEKCWGSVLSITVYGQDEEKSRAAAKKALDEIRRVESALSNLKSDSELSNVNKSASTKEIQVSDTLAEFLSKCIPLVKSSGGLFDPTVGAAIRAWGFYDDTHNVPDLAPLKKVTGFDSIQFDASRKTVKLKTKGVEIDSLYAGKGFAVDRAAAILKAEGVASALIEFGHTDIYAIGAPPNKDCWTITVTSPIEKEELGFVRLKDAALAIQSWYERYFERDNVVRSRVIDPRTCDSVTTVGMTCATGASAFECAVKSASLFVAGAKDASACAGRMSIVGCFVPKGAKLQVEKFGGFEIQQ